MPHESFLSLLEMHDHLDELFLLHQEAVLVTNWPLAVELFDAYRALMSIHIKQEEEQMMPLFAQAGSVPRAPVVLFTGQHRKLVSQLERIATTLGAAHGSDEPRRSAIFLLELGTAYKHLKEHHDGAEATYFYPTLAKLAGSNEWGDVVRRCWDQWEIARLKLQSLVAKAAQELDVRPVR